MITIKPELDAQQQGAFKLFEDETKQGEMVVAVNGDKMTVFHTEVAPENEGKGYAKLLLESMVAYARAQHLMVIALCPYVHLQFQRHPELYTDIWLQ